MTVQKLLYSCLPNRKLLVDLYLGYFVEHLLQLNIKRKLQSGRDKDWHSHWWKDLRRLYNQPDFHSIHQNMVWKVGCGDKIKFWQDSWLSEGCKHFKKRLLAIWKEGQFINNIQRKILIAEPLQTNPGWDSVFFSWPRAEGKPCCQIL